MDTVDEDYKFRCIDAATEGTCSDAQIFNESQLRDNIEVAPLAFQRPHPLKKMVLIYPTTS